MLAGMRMALEIAEQAPLTGGRAGAVQRARRRTPRRTSWRSSARAAQTVYHPTSTCAMGAVVDSELRGPRVRGLRVVDASVMPTITRGNTNAPDDHDRRARRGPDPRPRAARNAGRCRLAPVRPAQARRRAHEHDDRTAHGHERHAAARRTAVDRAGSTAMAGSMRRRRSTTVEPATGERSAIAGAADPAAVARAARSAAAAQPEWAERRFTSASRSCGGRPSCSSATAPSSSAG